jgi:hypothetical protein
MQLMNQASQVAGIRHTLVFVIQTWENLCSRQHG